MSYEQNDTTYVSNCDVSQVKTLKQKIEEERGKDVFPATGQKLIYAGESEVVGLFSSGFVRQINLSLRVRVI